MNLICLSKIFKKNILFWYLRYTAECMFCFILSLLYTVCFKVKSKKCTGKLRGLIGADFAYEHGCGNSALHSKIWIVTPHKNFRYVALQVKRFTLNARVLELFEWHFSALVILLFPLRFNYVISSNNRFTSRSSKRSTCAQLQMHPNKWQSDRFLLEKHFHVHPWTAAPFYLCSILREILVVKLHIRLRPLL